MRCLNLLAWTRTTSLSWTASWGSSWRATSKLSRRVGAPSIAPCSIHTKKCGNFCLRVLHMVGFLYLNVKHFCEQQTCTIPETMQKNRCSYVRRRKTAVCRRTGRTLVGPSDFLLLSFCKCISLSHSKWQEKGGMWMKMTTTTLFCSSIVQEILSKPSYLKCTLSVLAGISAESREGV